MSVKLIRTIAGEYIIGNQESELDDSPVVLTDARLISIRMTLKGPGISILPINPFTIKENNTVSINKSNIIQVSNEDEIQSELVTQYKSDVAGIVSSGSSGPDIII